MCQAGQTIFSWYFVFLRPLLVFIHGIHPPLGVESRRIERQYAGLIVRASICRIDCTRNEDEMHGEGRLGMMEARKVHEALRQGEWEADSRAGRGERRGAISEKEVTKENGRCRRKVLFTSLSVVSCCALVLFYPRVSVIALARSLSKYYLVRLRTSAVAITCSSPRDGQEGELENACCSPESPRWFLSVVQAAFRAEEGNTLVVADYGQLELRLLAHITDCKSMIEAFKVGRETAKALGRLLFHGGGGPSDHHRSKYSGYACEVRRSSAPTKVRTVKIIK